MPPLQGASAHFEPLSISGYWLSEGGHLPPLLLLNVIIIDGYRVLDFGDYLAIIGLEVPNRAQIFNAVMLEEISFKNGSWSNCNDVLNGFNILNAIPFIIRSLEHKHKHFELLSIGWIGLFGFQCSPCSLLIIPL